MSLLVDVFICRSDWFGSSSLGKEQRAVNLVMQEKSHFPAWRTSRNLQPASKCCRKTIFSPVLRHFLRVFLKVSSLQSTTLMYVLLDLSSSVPIYFSKNIPIPDAFVCPLCLFIISFYLPLPLVLFHPFEELTLVTLTPRILFGLCRRYKDSHGDIYVNTSLSNCHTAAEQCVVFSQSALPY